MINTNEVIYLSLKIISSVAIIWILACLILRNTNFNKNGDRRKNKHTKESDDRRSEVIEYHNNAVYRAFEFYFKITLAVFGGMAYVAITDKISNLKTANILLNAGSWLLIAAAIVFSAILFMHQKAKIERWPTRYKWWEPLLWIEFPLITAMMMVSITMRLLVLPDIVRS